MGGLMGILGGLTGFLTMLIERPLIHKIEGKIKETHE